MSSFFECSVCGSLTHIRPISPVHWAPERNEPLLCLACWKTRRPAETMLPGHIRERFYRMINAETAVSVFENWLYAAKELEQLLGPEKYLELIAFDFKQEGAQIRLANLLRHYIDWGAFETWKLLGMLREARLQTTNLPEILIAFYELYCAGYTFLRTLGIDYGLFIKIPQNGDTPMSEWHDLSPEQKKVLLAQIPPNLDGALLEVINWLENGRIVLTGLRDESDRLQFLDTRS